MKIFGAKRCPHCNTRVPLTRLYGKPWLSARWPCQQCGTILRFDPIRRVLVAAVVLALIGSLFYFGNQFLLAYYILGFAFGIIVDGVIAANDKPESDTKQ